jgi:hypothetical protein
MGEQADVLTVVVPIEPDLERSKGFHGGPVRGVVDLNVGRLRDSLVAEVGKLREVFNGVADAADGFAVDEVTLALEISAEGGFRLLGSATVAAGATITVTLKRQPSA